MTAPRFESGELYKPRIEHTGSESEPVYESKSEDLHESHFENTEFESQDPFESKFASADDPLAPIEGTFKASPSSKDAYVVGTKSKDPFEANFASAVHTSTSRKARKVEPEALDSWGVRIANAFEPSPAFGQTAFDEAEPNDESDGAKPTADRFALDGSVSRTEFDTARPFRKLVKTFTERKEAKTQKKDVPTYLFSNLVLDLGAENAAGVRDYDETNEKTLVEKWETPDGAIVASRKRLLSLTRDANRAKERYEELQRDPDSRHWRIRQSDILSIALRGVPAPPVDNALSTEESTPPENEAQVLGQTPSYIELNGIPKAIVHNHPTLLWWMAARNNDYEAADLTIETPVYFTKPLRRRGYDEFRRLLSAAIASKKGMGGSDDLQLRVYKNWLEGPDRPADLQSSYGVLLFLGELDTAFRMAGYRMKYHLCRVALEHASRGLFIEPAAHFLPLLTSWVTNVPPRHAPTTFPDAIGEALQGLLHSLETWAPGTELLPRSEVLSLLTGCGAAGRIYDFAFRDVMMHKGARGASYATYIELLARLGALRALWMEWGRITALEKDNAPDDPGLPKAEIFMQALVVAREAVRDYDLQDVEVCEKIEDAVLEDYRSMPVGLDFVGRSVPVDVPPRLPFQLIEAFEIDSMNEAVARIQQLIGQLD